MEFLDHALVIAWVCAAPVLSRKYPKPTAVLAIVMLGQMFLPEIQSVPIPPATIRPLRPPLLEFTKINAISYGLMLAIVIFDIPRLQKLRLRGYDWPVLVTIFCPVVTTLVNGATFEDAFALFRTSFLIWAVPYFVGRLYFNDASGCYRIVTAITLGGLIYVPLCLFEIRFSPLLHDKLYGFHQHSFFQTLRFGGYRPMVFMQHGLAVAFWMVAASLSAYALYRARVWPPSWMPRIIRSHAIVALLILTATAVLTKSLGAVILGAAGAAVLWLTAKIRLRVWLGILILIPILYTGGRVSGWLKRDAIVAAIGKEAETERFKSLDYRLTCEDVLIAEVDKHPVLGMAGTKYPGGKYTTRPLDANGEAITTDGLWIIQYFDLGTVGLVALLAFFLMPAWKFLRLHPPQSWLQPEVAPAAVAAAILTLYMIDCLFNGMLNPVFLMLVGALNCWNDLVARWRPFQRNPAKAFDDTRLPVFVPSSPM